MARYLLLLPLLFYLLLPTANYYWDGVAFATDIENRKLNELFHPNHLLYAAAGALLYESSHHAARALYILQYANAALSAACVVLVYLTLRRRKLSEQSSIAGALIFAFSATWWRFAADANAYVPAIFLLLLTNLLAMANRTIGAALTHAAAMLFHQLAILYYPAILYRMRNEPRKIAVYLGCSIVPVASVYVAVWHVTPHPTQANFLEWLVYHSPDSGFSWNALSSLGFTLLGTLRLFFGGKLSAFEPLPALFLIPAAIILIRRTPTQPERADLNKTTLIWLGAYLVFLFFWMPRNTFYRLFYLPPLLLAILHFKANPRLLATAASILLLWNLTFAIYPQSKPENNSPLNFALAQRRQWLPGTPVVFHRFHPDLWTIAYFNPQVSWKSFDRIDYAALREFTQYAASEKKPLWLEATAYDLLAADPQGRAWLAGHDAQQQIIYRDAKHEFRFHAVR